MANPWFRMYSEFSHDPKVQMMSEAMQRRLVMLMCIRCGNDLETLHETEIAFTLRISEAELAETKALFMGKGFIDSGWNLLNWEKRQFASDSSTSRVREFRERHKKQDETATKRFSNALEQNRTEQNRTEEPPHSLNSDMVASAVMTELRVGGMGLRVVLEEVARAELKAGRDAAELIREMVDAAQEYERAKPRLKWTSGLEKFFGGGDWRKKAGWPWKDGNAPKPVMVNPLDEIRRKRAEAEAALVQ